MFQALIAIVLTLLLVVGIHELGHAITASLFQVKIKRIAIGFGKPLLIWKDKANREWVWGLWPLGGYVQLLNSRIEQVSTSDLPYCFDKKPIWIRCLILLAGALTNILTAWFAFTLISLIGFKQHIPLIQDIRPNSLAAQAGLVAGDQIIAIANKPVDSWSEAGMQLLRQLGKKEVLIEANDPSGRQKQGKLLLGDWRYKTEDKSLFDSLGIKPLVSQKAVRAVAGKPFLPSAYLALRKTGELLAFFFIILKQIITGVLPFAVLLGPLGLVVTTVQSFLQGMVVFLYFIANFSLAVAFTNLFPIPGLDGGSIVFALVEKIRGKPLSVAAEILCYRLALIVITLFLIQLILNDLRHYIS